MGDIMKMSYRATTRLYFALQTLFHWGVCVYGQRSATTSLIFLWAMSLGVSLSLAAVKHIEAGVAATLMSLMPVLIIPPAILIKKERVTLKAMCGAVLAVSGAALLFL